MKTKLTIDLENSDFDTLHDVIVEVYLTLKINIPTKIDNATIEKIFNNLPDHIKLEAVEHGIGDTVVSDNMYVWLLNNRQILEI